MQAGADPCKSPRRRRAPPGTTLASPAMSLLWRVAVLRESAVPQNSTSSLFVRLGASPQLIVVLGSLHLGAIPCGFANDLPPAIQGLVALCVLLAGMRCIALHGSRRAARAIVLLVWDRLGQWRLVQRDGRVLDVCLEPGGYVHPKLVVLAFRTRSGRRLRVLIAPDMVDADRLRRLRTRLRCEPPRSP